MCTFYFGGFMNRDFLELAFKYAELAFKDNEVPIGAVIVKDGDVISYGFNQKEKEQSVLKHAELIAIENASKKLNNWRFDGCDIYVTLDPCPMCASAIKQARIRNVYSALSNSDSSNLSIIQEIFKKDSTNPDVHFETNLDVEKSKKILNDFFKKHRDN